MRSQTTSVCVEPALDANGDVVVVSDCVCDSTCEICGYYGEAVSGSEDCFTCPAGLVFSQLYDDGSGTCTVSDGTSATEVPTAASSSTSAPTGSTGGGTSSGTASGICMMIYQVAGT